MQQLLRGFTIPVIFALLWEAGSRAHLLPLDTFSRPSDIAIAGVNALFGGEIVWATAETLQTAFEGLLLAVAVGVPLGVVVGISRTARWAISPTLDAIRSVPPVAMIPLSLLIFGFGVRMEAAVVAFASIWSITIATTAAARSTEARLAEVAQTLEMSTAGYVRKVVLPSAVGRIAVGVRLATGIALVVAVTVEIVVNPRGMGYALIIAEQSARPDLMYAQLAWIGFIGWLINWTMVEVDRIFLIRFSVKRGRP